MMGNVITLRQATRAEAKFTYITRPHLSANKCANCGKIFQMVEFCNEVSRGELHGTFDKSSNTLGNIFSCSCCSFACAQQLVDGKWKEIEEYKEFVEMGAELARVHLCVTKIKDKEQLIKEWEANEAKPEDMYVESRI
jgi:uncharacterized Fe-S center protein